MTRIAWERALWGCALGFGLIGVLSMRDAASSASAEPRRANLGAVPQPPSVDSLLDALDESEDNNLFRIDRAPFDASRVPAAPVTSRPAAPGRPTLVLRGLVGGAAWDVLIDGIPGREGATVLRVGQRMNGYAVRAVRHDTVLVSGPDTTWKLTLRRQ